MTSRMNIKTNTGILYVSEEIAQSLRDTKSKANPCWLYFSYTYS